MPNPVGVGALYGPTRGGRGQARGPWGLAQKMWVDYNLQSLQSIFLGLGRKLGFLLPT